MRGFSSGFPRRGAGVGLLLLRAAVGLQWLFESGGAPVSPWWPQMLAIVLALMLMLGVLTPVAAAISAAHQLLCMTDAEPVQILPQALAAMTALALVLLGPGAYALDARLFGRRRLVLPAGRVDRS